MTVETFQMRTSERASFKRCPQKWHWSIVEGLKPLRAKTPLWFGSAWHEGMAAWYLKGLERGPHPAETFSATLAGDRKFLVANEEDELVYEDARAMGIEMAERYVETYGIDETWEVIAIEQPFQVWIPHPSLPKKRWLRYVGTWDGVIRDLLTGEVWLIEHKTAASLGTAHLPLDDQAGSYWMVANSKLRQMGVLKPGESIAGIRYSFARKARKDERPTDSQGRVTNKPIKKHFIEALSAAHVEGVSDKWKLETLAEKAEELKLVVLGDVSAVQPAPYFLREDVYRSVNQRKKMLQKIQNEALIMEGMRRGTLPLFKTPTQFGGMPCTSCEFFRLCRMDEQGDEFLQDFKESEFTVVDPYADHRYRKSSDG